MQTSVVCSTKKLKDMDVLPSNFKKLSTVYKNNQKVSDALIYFGKTTFNSTNYRARLETWLHQKQRSNYKIVQ
jgi:hypothetical protein